MDSAYQTMIIAWAAMICWVAIVIAFNRKQHPKVLFFLFTVELWERFSYYGMRAFLVLYLTKTDPAGGFGFAKDIGNGIYAAYGALVYLTPLAGGYLADKLLGFRKSIIWGAVLMAAGQFTLSQSSGQPWVLYTGLALLVTGNGFFKPNISSLIGRLYPAGDIRRDGAFTIFYMGINIGAFLAPLTCGVVAEKVGWNYGFLLAGSGMVVGLILFLVTSKLGLLENKADSPAAAAGVRVAGLPVDFAVFVGSLLFIPVLSMLIHQNDVMDYILGSLGLFAIVYMFILSLRFEKVDRERMWVVMVLLVFTTIFWTFFELAGSALNLFTDKNVDKTFLGLELTTSSYQAFNPLFIIAFAPLFSVMWTTLARKNLEPAAPLKFAGSLLLLGAGFLVMNLGLPFVHDGLMPALFLIMLYLLHTWGELAMSPVGLSLVTKLAPAQIAAFMMGFWFLSSSIAHQAGKRIANLTNVDESVPPEQSLSLALGVFNSIGWVAIGCGLFLVILSPFIRRWMHGVK